MAGVNVFEYSDYRLFLKDYYEVNKKSRPNFSYRYLSQKAGMNAPAFFKYLIEGKRGLTKTTLLKVVRALGLSVDEADYFESLVYFNQAKALKEKDHFFSKLMERRTRVDLRELARDQYEIFFEWHHSVIRELVTLNPKEQNPAHLSKQVTPPISSAQAKDSLALLLRLGFIQPNPDGAYQQTNPLMTTGQGVKDHALRHFQMATLKLALEAYERFAPEEKLMSATTFSLSDGSFAEIKARLRQLRKDLIKMVNVEKNPNRVYQLNMNLFPLSQKITHE